MNPSLPGLGFLLLNGPERVLQPPVIRAHAWLPNAALAEVGTELRKASASGDQLNNKRRKSKRVGTGKKRKWRPKRTFGGKEASKKRAEQGKTAGG